MVKKTALIVLAILLATSLFGQIDLEEKELKVINMLRAKVYEKPTFESRTLKDLSLGETVMVDEEIDTHEEYFIGTGFSLPGNWIKPKGMDGYIFSSDLTNKKMELGWDKWGEPWIDLFGELMKEEVEGKRAKTPDGESSKQFTYSYYENGTQTHIVEGNRVQFINKYKNLSINEVYHQLVSDIGFLSGEGYVIPEFLEKAEHKIMFGGRTEEVTMELNEDESITVAYGW